MTQFTETDARQMIAVANTRNVDRILEQYADDATFQAPMLDKPLKGKDAIRAFLSGSFTAFPDWNLDLQKVVVSGNETFTVDSVRGTHEGALTSVDGKSTPATHRKFVQEQMTRVILNEKGKIQSLRSYGNPVELYRQLGLSQ
jgi:steroid delta-isomerase-like uncharacterized protein